MNLKEWIKKQEGFSSLPYLDTKNRLTIGYGRNIGDNGISVQEAEFLFNNDFERCKKELSEYQWYMIQPVIVQGALINMCFNLGIKRLLGFKKMIAALYIKDYAKAAKEALDSQWATQVGQRAKDIAVMISEQ